MAAETLDQISFRYQVDKNPRIGHNYVPAYTALFEGDKRASAKRVLEIEIGASDHQHVMRMQGTTYCTGNSLRCWRDYFKQAQVFGIDIHNIGDLGEERIQTFTADQSDPSQLQRVVDSIGGPLDVIIDDGSHIASHQVASFTFLEQHLAPGGIYAIEDVQPHAIEAFKDLSIFPEATRDRIRQAYSVQYFDTRKTQGKRDDFIMALLLK